MPDDQATTDRSTFTEFGLMVAEYSRSDLHTMIPGTVIAYHKPKGTGDDRTPALVDVRVDLLYRRRIENPDDVEDGETAIERTDGWHAQGKYPTLTSVPVAYPGHDGMRSVGPIKPDAHGWLVFCERSIDRWINVGGPVDPAFDKQWHHLTDAIWFPGARYGRVAEDIPDDSDRVGSADGSAGMEIALPGKEISVTTTGPTATLDAATAIKLGEAATLGIARLTDPVGASVDMAAYMAAVVTALNALAAAVPVVIVPPIPPATIGQISGASTKALSE